jgi:hypothetical protein
MPWHYFDGKLLQQKYILTRSTNATQEQLCEDTVRKIVHRNAEFCQCFQIFLTDIITCQGVNVHFK